MTDNILSKRALGKWITLAVVLAVVAFVLLTRFTSFQIPTGVIDDTPVSQQPGGVQSQGSTETRNNLDAVNDIIRGNPERTQDGGAVNGE